MPSENVVSGVEECWGCGRELLKNTDRAYERGHAFCAECVERFQDEEREMNRSMGLLAQFAYGDRRRSI